MIYHIRFKTIKMPGSMTCPITGKLIRNNRLVDDTPRSLEENRAIIDDKLGLSKGLKIEFNNYFKIDDYMVTNIETISIKIM